jgi:hypothetical protein
MVGGQRRKVPQMIAVEALAVTALESEGLVSNQMMTFELGVPLRSEELVCQPGDGEKLLVKLPVCETRV